ncbi:MAG TPA: ATP-binding protein [Candidatus Omnitrophica bacterium]|nr:ATP-binding protein [Candidatus Omnitrophota bacterium]
METQRIKGYIEDWYGKELPLLLPRELKVTQIQGKVIGIVGPRRAGKTYYFFQLMKPVKEVSLYLDFEDSSLFTVKFDEVLEIANLFTEITGKEPKYIFLDEIQNLEKWETAVRTLLDRTPFNIFVTGSSSKLLSKEIATQLRGRSLTYILLPFSFREFLKAKKIELKNVFTQIEKAKMKKYLREYLELGGFPEVVLKEEREKILKEYFDTIFFRDFVERHELKSLEIARFIFSFVFQNFSSEISVNKIVNFLKSEGKKFGKNTVYSYIEKLQDTQAVFFVNRISGKIYIKESWPRKIYICDPGISTIFRFSEDIGKLMENAVFLELKRMQNENPLLEIYYYKDYQQREVDFVLKEGLEVKQLIQVTYASGRAEIGKREADTLLKVSSELKCNNLIIITWDYEDDLVVKNKPIKCIPLWKWLITSNSTK